MDIIWNSRYRLGEREAGLTSFCYDGKIFYSTASSKSGYMLADKLYKQ